MILFQSNHPLFFSVASVSLPDSVFVEITQSVIRWRMPTPVIGHESLPTVHAPRPIP
jgi:hypothetical protein